MTRHDDSPTDRPVDSLSRRSLLAGAAAAAAGGFGTATATRTQEPAETFELYGVADYWVGRGPEAIAGEKNPTLDLEAGEPYRIVWENGDGRSHNVSIYTTAGNLVVFSPFMDSEGDTQTVDFVATGNMVQYYCDVHYLSMRGDLEVSGETGREPDPVDPGYFPEGPAVGLREVARGFSYPVAMTVPPDGERVFVADQSGQVYVFDAEAVGGDRVLDASRREPFVDISDRIFHERGPHPETGLLGWRSTPTSPTTVASTCGTAPRCSTA